MVENKYLNYKKDKTVVSARINAELYKEFKATQDQLAVFDIELSLSNVLEIAIREALVESELTYATL